MGTSTSGTMDKAVMGTMDAQGFDRVEELSGSQNRF